MTSVVCERGVGNLFVLPGCLVVLLLCIVLRINGLGGFEGERAQGVYHVDKRRSGVDVQV